MSGPTTVPVWYHPINLIPVPHSGGSGQPVPAPAPVTSPFHGNSSEQAFYAEQLELGLGMDKNVEESVSWYTKAAESGHKQALLALARLYLQGVGADVDLSTRIKHVKAAVDLKVAGALNCAEDLNFIGMMYEARQDLSTRFLMVLDKRLTTVFPDLPNPPSSCRSNPGNWTKAFNFYSRASELGCMDAIANLGRCFHEGKGTKKDEAKALAYAALAAAEGSAEGMYRKGLVHLKAKGKLGDLTQARFYLEKAARLDHAPAQYELAGLCGHGRMGQQTDLKAAFHWASKAASSGYAPGLRRLAYCYHMGLGTQRDYHQAFGLYQAAAESGDIDAMYLLGWMYFKGKGTEVDFESARGCFQKAADAGCPQAQFYLGYSYRRGIGGRRDLFLGSVWREMAKDQGVDSLEQCAPQKLYLVE